MTIPFGQLSFPQIYEQALVGPLFRPWAELLLDEVAAAPGDRILDVACGTGIVSRLAHARLGGSGRVVGVDLSPAMLAVAGEVEPGVDWRPGNAGSLPLQEGETFDVVVCQQGLQFFPDRTAAAAGMRRALAPNGRLGVSTWRPDQEIPLFQALREVAERYVGPVADRRHCFGETAPLVELFEAAGFQDVRSAVRSCRIRFDDGAAFVRLNAMALIGMSRSGKDLGEDERRRAMAEIAEASSAVTPPYSEGRAVSFDLKSNVLTARA